MPYVAVAPAAVVDSVMTGEDTVLAVVMVYVLVWAVVVSDEVEMLTVFPSRRCPDS